MNEQKPTEKWDNPWLEILYAPQRAFNRILEKNPYSDIHFLLLFPVSALALSLPYDILIASAISSVTTAIMPQIPKVSTVLVGFVYVLHYLLNLLILLLTMLIFGSMAKWVGSLMGGKSNYRKLYSVLMWAGLPGVYLHLLLGIILIFERNLFNIVDLNQFRILIYLVLLWVVSLVGIGYTEAHQFSIKKGLLLAFITYGIPALIIYSYTGFFL